MSEYTTPSKSGCNKDHLHRESLKTSLYFLFVGVGTSRILADAFHRSDPVGSWPVASRGNSGSDETNNNLIGLVAACQFLNSPLFVIRLVAGCGDCGEIIQSTVSACGLRVSGCSATRSNEISNILVTGY